ncbi:hypothetical protein L596_007514 [Steinernema carpocapsae]|uniref:SNF-related serine/threonine-protein kinase n=1 Tax=Steinernema carpocapsae TaxID=34508 RepID=A0A4U5P9J4_STECR|nr:hypothetical protein L596_007514 [Steinernema carpocapsae]
MSTKLRRKTSIHDARIAGLYDLEHTIGKGHFAVVKLARHVFTGEKVAVKIIDKTKLDPVSTNHIMQEVRCMKLVQHPNIVRLYEVIDTQTKLFLILELGDYDMYDFIMKNGEEGCKEPVAQQYFSQIIKAIDYCHALHVVHRDLKPENVVFFEKLGMVKLTDFGFSNLYVPGELLRTSCGSLAYSAPEILLGDSYDAPAVDVWSLGVILYMLVCGKLPFEEANESETLTQILDCRYKRPEGVSEECFQLISRMLVRDPAKRAALTEIAENPWVVAGDRGHAEMLPLIAREHLPEVAHSTIVEQMVAGGIGSEEEIICSIESDDYTYLTATYYLLAERVLSTYREEQATRLVAEAAEKSEVESEVSVLVDASAEKIPSSSTCTPNHPIQSSSTGVNRSRSRSNSWRGSAGPIRRPCSILKEESEEELSTYLRSSSRHSSRNSSPSVSMFGLGSSLSSSRDRVSPQAIQDLLEVTRLSGGMRRAASPDSRISSRSPSPPGSSGRVSPQISFVSRLKVSNNVVVGGLVGGGMRKLSSSPHLLGICEEGEEGSDGSFSISPNESASSENRDLLNSSNFTTRSTRSASTGLATAGGRSSQKGADSVTYSSVRMIRARQAVVSPDLCRRYDQHHQRLLTRTKRSTSCSSSEASDDDSNERRLNLIGMKYCKHRSDRHDDEEPPQAGNGGKGNASKKPIASTPQIAVSGDTTSDASSQSQHSSADNGTRVNAVRSSCSNCPAVDPSTLSERLQLHTIMESPSNPHHSPSRSDNSSLSM